MTSPLSISEQLLKSAFEQPQKYRDLFLNLNLIKGNRRNFSGKTFICVSLTRFCPVGCKFCFFKSGPVFKQATHEDHFTPEGLKHFIDFCNDINLGYLLVSGGGEPMMERKSILNIIKDVDAERIVLVTSAHWAKTPESAKRYLDDIVEALNSRGTQTQLTVRVSVDAEHAATLSLDPIKNLIHLFTKAYGTQPQLDLQIHSLDGDHSIDNIIKELQDSYVIQRQNITDKRISDGKNAIKIVPKQEIIYFDQLMVKVGYAKTFYSDLKVDLNREDIIERNVAVYQKDLIESEDGNSSIVTNKLGNPGLDFWINYNGNVTTWGNQFLDNLFNLYEDSTDAVIDGTLSDPAALSFIEKGAVYRDRILNEANKTAVHRSKAVNIRDYTGALLFDEARTRLYYTIRALQDYISEGRIEAKTIEALPKEAQLLLCSPSEQLIQTYQQEYHTIVEQLMENENKDPDYILDILEWIRLGHYQLSEEKIRTLIDYYNTLVDDVKKIDDLSNFPNGNLKMQIVRMTEHLTHIKPTTAVLNDFIENTKVA